MDKTSIQSELYGKVVGALVESTPDHWYSFNLSLSKGDSGFVHSVVSNEGYKDLVSPSEKVLLATRNLQLYQDSITEPFSEAVFKVWLGDSDNWRYEAKFEY